MALFLEEKVRNLFIGFIIGFILGYYAQRQVFLNQLREGGYTIHKLDVFGRQPNGN